MKIEFDEKKLLKVLFWIAVGIVGVNIVDAMVGRPFWQITRVFDLTSESNFTTWFSSVLLLVASVFAFRISTEEAVGKRRNLWAWVSLGFVFLSMDETAMIHEGLGYSLEKLSSQQGTNLEWIIYLAALPVLLGFFIYYFKSFPWKERAFWIFGLGVFVFVLGAGVIDTLIFAVPEGFRGVLFPYEPFLEEPLEMFGIILVIKGLGLFCAEK